MPVYKAVHLEVVHSLSTQSYVIAIRRFVARRGTFRSGNGRDGLCDDIYELGYEVTFNHLLVTHMGGLLERMIRSVKVVIADHPRHPNDEVLETVGSRISTQVTIRSM